MTEPAAWGEWGPLVSQAVCSSNQYKSTSSWIPEMCQDFTQQSSILGCAPNQDTFLHVEKTKWQILELMHCCCCVNGIMWITPAWETKATILNLELMTDLKRRVMTTLVRVSSSSSTTEYLRPHLLPFKPFTWQPVLCHYSFFVGALW